LGQERWNDYFLFERNKQIELALSECALYLFCMSEFVERVIVFGGRVRSPFGALGKSAIAGIVERGRSRLKRSGGAFAASLLSLG
jgi:hypothetical protein